MKIVVRSLQGDEELQGGVAKLRTLVYPDHPAATDANWHSYMWNWLWSHPLAEGNMHRWVLFDEDQQAIVGHLAATPQYYRIDGRRVIAHTPADYMALPQYGFHALLLMRKFFRTFQNCVACDMVPEAIKVETSMGAEEVGKLQYEVKLLDVTRLPSLPASIPAPIPSLLNRGLRMIDRVRTGSFEGNLKVEMLEGFDASFDELFERIAAVVPCIPEKDAAFLRWRYGPDSPTAPVTVLGVRGEDGLLGYAVLKVSTPIPWEPENGYLIDLMTLPGRHDVAGVLLREAARHFMRSGVYIVRYRFLESSTSPQLNTLKRFGFFSRNKRRNTLLVKFADQNLQETARNLANWSYNVGDGEATFWLR
jgi:hypothetical protein